MSLRRLRLAPVVLAAVAVLALGWGAEANGGGSAFELPHDGQTVSSIRPGSPTVATGADERLDSRNDRQAKSRWIPVAVAAALLAGVEAVRRRYRHRGAITVRLDQRSFATPARAPPYLLVTAH